MKPGSAAQLKEIAGALKSLPMADRYIIIEKEILRKLTHIQKATYKRVITEWGFSTVRMKSMEAMKSFAEFVWFSMSAVLGSVAVFL